MPISLWVDNDVNYDSSIKAFAFLLNNHCNVSIDKVRQFLSDLTGGALKISKGMINGLSREFAEKSVAEQKKVFSDLVGAPVLNEDFTTALAALAKVPGIARILSKAVLETKGKVCLF